jgi:hypothetical protein
MLCAGPIESWRIRLSAICDPAELGVRRIRCHFLFMVSPLAYLRHNVPSSLRVYQDEKTRLVLRFRNPDLNSAAALLALECVWTFTDQPENIAQIERGWEIYRYFEKSAKECDIAVRFYSQGKLLSKRPVTGIDGTSTEGIPVVIQEKITPMSQESRNLRWYDPKSEQFQRFAPEALQLGAALLVPLATLAVTPSGEVNSGNYRDLIGLGFGSEVIRGILTPPPEQRAAPAQPSSPQ